MVFLILEPGEAIDISEFNDTMNYSLSVETDIGNDSDTRANDFLSWFLNNVIY